MYNFRRRILVLAIVLFPQLLSAQQATKGTAKTQDESTQKTDPLIGRKVMTVVWGVVGMLVGVIQGAALLWAMVMGYLLDKIDRVTGVIIAFTLAAIGYSSFGLMDDPFSNSILLPAIVLGMGETSTIIAGNALIGQSAPAAVRGAVLGSFALCGALGILVATSLGGRVFDFFAPRGPFLQMGIINALVLAFALYVRAKTKAA